MKLIENNPNLNWTRVRRRLARWVNHVRTSDSLPRSLNKGIRIDTHCHIPSDAHHLGDFTAVFVESWGSLKTFSFYNAFCGVAIDMELGIRNDGRESEESKNCDVKLVTVSIYEAVPLEKKDPDHIQPILISNQLCSITYLIGQHASARSIRVNGRDVEDFSKIHVMTLGPIIWAFLDFVIFVIEKGQSYKEFIPEKRSVWICSDIARQSGWKKYQQVTEFASVTLNPYK